MITYQSYLKEVQQKWVLKSIKLKTSTDNPLIGKLKSKKPKSTDILDHFTTVLAKKIIYEFQITGSGYKNMKYKETKEFDILSGVPPSSFQTKLFKEVARKQLNRKKKRKLAPEFKMQITKRKRLLKLKGEAFQDSSCNFILWSDKEYPATVKETQRSIGVEVRGDLTQQVESAMKRADWRGYAETLLSTLSIHKFRLVYTDEDVLINYEFWARLSRESDMTRFLQSLGISEQIMSKIEVGVEVKSDPHFLEELQQPDWLRFMAALDLKWKVTDYFIVKKISACFDLNRRLNTEKWDMETSLLGEAEYEMDQNESIKFEVQLHFKDLKNYDITARTNDLKLDILGNEICFREICLMLQAESNAMSGFKKAVFQAGGHSFEMDGFVSLNEASWDIGIYTSIKEFSINDVCDLWQALNPNSSKPNAYYNIVMRDTMFSISTAQSRFLGIEIQKGITLKSTIQIPELTCFPKEIGIKVSLSTDRLLLQGEVGDFEIAEGLKLSKGFLKIELGERNSVTVSGIVLFLGMEIQAKQSLQKIEGNWEYFIKGSIHPAQISQQLKQITQFLNLGEISYEYNSIKKGNSQAGSSIIFHVTKILDFPLDILLIYNNGNFICKAEAKDNSLSCKVWDQDLTFKSIALFAKLYPSPKIGVMTAFSINAIRFDIELSVVSELLTFYGQSKCTLPNGRWRNPFGICDILKLQDRNYIQILSPLTFGLGLTPELIPTVFKLQGGLKIGDFKLLIKDFEVNEPEHFLSLEGSVDNFSSNTFLNMIYYIAFGEDPDSSESRFELFSLRKLYLNLKLYPENMNKSRMDFKLKSFKICDILKVNQLSTKVDKTMLEFKGVTQRVEIGPLSITNYQRSSGPTFDMVLQIKKRLKINLSCNLFISHIVDVGCTLDVDPPQLSGAFRVKLFEKYSIWVTMAIDLEKSFFSFEGEYKKFIKEQDSLVVQIEQTLRDAGKRMKDTSQDKTKLHFVHWLQTKKKRIAELEKTYREQKRNYEHVFKKMVTSRKRLMAGKLEQDEESKDLLQVQALENECRLLGWGVLEALWDWIKARFQDLFSCVTRCPQHCEGRGKILRFLNIEDLCQSSIQWRILSEIVGPDESVWKGSRNGLRLRRVNKSNKLALQSD